MSKILTGQYNSTGGLTYIVEIHDQTQGADLTDEFIITERPDYRRNGRTKDIYQDILSMSYTINMRVEVGSPAESFVNQFIAETDESRFYAKIYRSGSIHYIGYLQIDQSSIPIRSQTNYSFSLQCTDRLGQSGNYDYNDPTDPDNPLRGVISIKEHIRLLLISIGMGDLYGASDTFLKISISYHNSLMPNTTDDFSDRIYLDQKIFASEVEEQFKVIRIPVFPDVTIPLGEQPSESGNAKSSIEQLCFICNASLFQSGGVFYFVSRERLLNGPGISYYRYSRDGSLLSTPTESSSVTIGSLTVNNTGHFCLPGGVYTFQTPIKELIIDHNKGGGANKITGAEWRIENHPNRCFQYINNAGLATILGRFVFKLSVKSLNGNVESFFRAVIGVKIKVGSYYLKRELTAPGVYANGNDSPLPLQETEYDPATWTQTESYYKYVIDTRSGSNYRLSADDIFILDIDSPPIPVPGELCVDIDVLEIRRFDSFVFLFDDKWDTVSFSNESEFSQGGDNFRYYWQATDNYINIQSDDGELNEDTLAYDRYIAQVRLTNSERLEYTTAIGDDPGSNTHGRVQIDQSVAGDGSDLVDADGGWSIDGTGPTYTNIVELLAWDMARLRVGVIRVMNATLRSSSISYSPQTLITFDGKVMIMGQLQTTTANEQYKGTWFSIEDVDSSQITIINKKYGKATASDPNVITIASQDPNTAKPTVYIYETTGITADYIQIPTSKPLPDPSLYGETAMNGLFLKSQIGTAFLKYKINPSGPSHFTINKSQNRIILFRTPRVEDEYLFQWSTDI